MPSSSSKPVIPRRLVQKLKADRRLRVMDSAVFHPDGHSFRAQYIKGSEAADIRWGSRCTVIHPPGERCFDEGETLLHGAAKRGDAGVALEIIRLGASIDPLDKRGFTPLMSGMFGLVKVKAASTARMATFNTQQVGQSQAHDIYADDQYRIAWVCNLLIEQHADVNIVVNDHTPLDLACRVEHRDLIVTLLRHGANPHRRSLKGLLPVDRFTTPDIKALFLNLAEIMFNNNERPARPCPCWSGKLLDECHRANLVPYPSEFTCRCGSGRTYGRCCSKRNAEFRETWDERTQTLVALEVCHADSLVSPRMTAWDTWRLANLMEYMAGVTADFGFAQAFVMGRAKQGIMLEEFDYWQCLAILIGAKMLPAGLVDPAFLFAMPRACFLPLHNGRVFSKLLGTHFSATWNTYVDEYISLGIDKREPIEIERAAKIGANFSALYRTCEGPDCQKLEGRDISKLRFCSKCKISVYCSKECLRSHWKAHKSICCQSDEQIGQMLPSQIALKDYVFPSMMEQLLRDIDEVLETPAYMKTPPADWSESRRELWMKPSCEVDKDELFPSQID